LQLRKRKSVVRAALVNRQHKMSSVQWGDETAVRNAVKDVRSDTTETNWYLTLLTIFYYSLF
jgi:putative component of toxin-antitoxin plasmid stabilization module